MTKLVIVIDSGSLEKLQTMSMVVSGAVASDFEVYLFFMYDAAYALRKDNPSSKLDQQSIYPEVTDKYKAARKEGKVHFWTEILEELKEIGELKIVACSQVSDITGLTKENLMTIVDDIAGVAALAEEIKDADNVIVI
ncbi:MAG: DsrE family protein [Candidatus Odinarchaeota archaeon]